VRNAEAATSPLERPEMPVGVALMGGGVGWGLVGFGLVWFGGVGVVGCVAGGGSRGV